MDDTVDRILKSYLKPSLVVLFSSGFVLNAIFVAGLLYYQGYLRHMGFDYEMFPIARYDAFFWAYAASIYSGAKAITFWSSYFLALVPAVFITVFLVLRFWKICFSTTEKEGKKDSTPRPLAQNIVYSLTGVQVFLTGILLIAVWTLFPLSALWLGESGARAVLSDKEGSLCTYKNSQWDSCIEFEVDGESIRGELLFKNGDLLGILTEDGPVTMSMPDTIFYLRDKVEQN